MEGRVEFSSKQSAATFCSIPTTSSSHITEQNYSKPTALTTSSISATIVSAKPVPVTKFRLPPVPNSVQLKPRASAAQASATSSVTRATFSPATPNSAIPDTHMTLTNTPPTYLVQAKGAAKPKAQPKQLLPVTTRRTSPMPPRALPSTPCSEMTTEARRSAAEPERNKVRPSK